jgi:hypothetical protein
MDDEMNVEMEAGDAPVKPDELAALKSALDEIRDEAGEWLESARSEAEDVRYCRWAGQSADGRKHRAALGRDAKPFEGASDNRVRLADGMVAKAQLQMVAAATRALPKAVGTESGDAARAGKVDTLLRYTVRNLWRSEWRRQCKLLAGYALGDEPGVGAAWVDWRYERGMAYEELTREQALDALAMSDYGRGLGELMGEQAVGDIADMLANPLRREELADALGATLPQHLKRRQLLALADDLQDDEKAAGRFTREFVACSEPRFEALRVMDDVFFPLNSTDVQRMPHLFRRYWLTRAEVLTRAADEGWSDAFVEGLLGRDGESGQDGKSALESLDWTLPGERRAQPLDRWKGLYEVLRCWERTVDANGVGAIHVTTFSYFVEVAAKERELWDRKHGRLPLVLLARETLTSRLLDSRGLPTLLATDQSGLKLLRDSFEDHVQKMIHPPIKKPANRPYFKIDTSPFGEVESDPRNPVEYMKTADYPRAADTYWTEARREAHDAAGIFDAQVWPNEGWGELHAQDRVDGMLACLAEVLGMTVQLWQQFGSDELLARVVGGTGIEAPRSVEEIAGSYDVQISYDVRDMTMEGVVEKARVVLENIRPLDANGIVPYDLIVRQVVASVDPNWADAIPPAEVASGRIALEEKGYFVMMLNGVRPPMKESEDAPALRLQTLQEEMQPRVANPAAFAPLGAASMALMEERVKYLEFQSQQQENAVTGRTGVEPVDLRVVGAEGGEA